MGRPEKIVGSQPAVWGKGRTRRGAEGSIRLPCALTRIVEDQLRRGPLHECNLSCQDGQGFITMAEHTVQHARKLFNATIDRKLAVLQNAAVQERLEQGG